MNVKKNWASVLGVNRISCNAFQKSTPFLFMSFIMALFHCMVRHGTVRYGSLLGGFPLGTVPGT